MIRVGQIVGAFGIEGAVKVEALTDYGDRFAPGARLVLDGVDRQVEWSRDRGQAGSALVLKLSGIEDRTLAAALRGRYLEIPDRDAREPPPGSWFHHQLVGLAVSTQGGEQLGTLTAVLERPANDVWIARRGAVERLIPATRDAIVEVDTAGGTVTVADWLLEVEDA